jgi:hypothetical protein
MQCTDKTARARAASHASHLCAEIEAARLKEAKQLRAIWDASSLSLTQQAFGEKFGIGNQSAVGQFLHGRTPLSMKAAIGFASGLKVRLEDFSPRLANEAVRITKALEELNEYTPSASTSALSPDTPRFMAETVGKPSLDALEAGLMALAHSLGREHAARVRLAINGASLKTTHRLAANLPTDAHAIGAALDQHSLEQADAA